MNAIRAQGDLGVWRRICIAVAMLLLAGGVTLSAATIYVDQQASGVNDGATWVNAYTNLQDAITAAPIQGTSIWVAAGTYYPGPDRTDTFQLRSGVEVYGGFTNGMLLLEERNPGFYITTLSGETGDGGTATDNCYHVVSGASLARLDGFTVTAGWADGVNPNDSGGGLYNSSMSPILANCIIQDNYAVNGGGVFNSSASPTFINCTLKDNTASANGGAINGGTVTATGCTFDNNIAASGWGLYGTAAGSYFDDCVFKNHPGTVYQSINVTHTFTNCTFRDNSAYCLAGGYPKYTVLNSRFFSNGGGISQSHKSAANATIKDSVFVNNAGTCLTGAGMWYPTRTLFLDNNTAIAGWEARLYANNLTFAGNVSCIRNNYMAQYETRNCLFSGNDGANGVAIWGVSHGATYVNVANSTFFKNQASSGGAIYKAGSGTFRITNSVLWANTPGQTSGGGTYGHCNVEGGIAGTNNIDADPEFLDMTTGTLSYDGVFDSVSYQSTLTDVTASWLAGEFAGLLINPDTGGNAKHFYIITNTEDTITVWSDVGGLAQAGDTYEIYNLDISHESPCIDAGAAHGAPTNDYAQRPRPQGAEYDIGAFEFEPDYEAPDPISELASLGGEQLVRFDWTNPTNLDYSGVLVLRRPGDYPTGVPTATNIYVEGTNIGDGLVVYRGRGTDYRPGAESRWKDTGLTNGVTYYYSFFAYDEIPNYSVSAETNGVPEADAGAPAGILGLTAVGGDVQIELGWTNPSDIDYEGVLVIRKKDSPPGNVRLGESLYSVGDEIGEGTVVHVGSGSNSVPGEGTGWVDTGLDNASTYYYKLYAFDEVPSYSDAVITSAVTLADYDPPDPVAFLQTSIAYSSVTLSWVNPTNADYAGVMITRKVDSPPSGVPVHSNVYTAGSMLGDGDVVYVGAGREGTPGVASHWEDTAVGNWSTYHYDVFAYDEVPNYSVVSRTNAHPTGEAIFVDYAATGSNQGTNWADAFTNLQDALAVVPAQGTSIWVAAGTYYPGPARTDTFMLKNDVVIYGGLTSGMTRLDTRDWRQHVTVLSGNIGAPLSAADNSYHVLGGANNARLDGLIVSDGNANGAAPDDAGGGMSNSASLTIVNCRFEDNLAVNGGAIYNYSGTLTMTNSTFLNNIATGNGGAIAGGTILATACVFNDNSAASGWGLYLTAAGSSYTDCRFTDHGGTVYQCANTTHTFINCTFRDNAAYCIVGSYPNLTVTECQFFNNGGGISESHKSAAGLNITDSVFVENTGICINGAGMWYPTRCLFLGNNTAIAGWEARLRVNRCMFAGNTSCIRNNYMAQYETHNSIFSGNNGAAGCAIWGVNHGATYVNACNSTFFRNVASSDGVIHKAGGGTFTITNCVMWGNSPEQVSGGGTYGYCDVQGGLAGTSNLNVNPMYPDVVGGTWSYAPVFDTNTYQTTFHDATLTWPANKLIGLLLNPAATVNSNHYYIADNGENTITVWGDATAVTAPGATYEIYDLKPLTVSPLLNAGTTHGAPIVDYDGDSRPQNGFYDIGAYEGGQLTGVGPYPAGVVILIE